MTDRPSGTIFQRNKQGVIISNGRHETTLDTRNGSAFQLQQQITSEKPNGIIPEGHDQIAPEERNGLIAKRPNGTTSHVQDQTATQGQSQNTSEGEYQTTAGKIQGHPAALDAILAKIKSVAERAKQEEKAKQSEIARQKEENSSKKEEEAKRVEQAEQEEKDDEKAEQTEQERILETSINWGDELSKDEKATMVSIKEINSSRIVTDPNILHEIARRGSEFEDYHSFVKWLLGLRKLSNILLQQKSKLYHRRPLQLALENENSDFVKTILDNFKDRTSSEKGDGGDNLTLATLLRPESPKAFEMNCIHLAIGARSPHTIDIIEACKDSVEIFMQRDTEKTRETPLHLAAVCGVTALSQSPSENKFNALDVVNKLIEMCPGALYAMNTDGETPYRSRIRALGDKTGASAGRASQVYPQGQNGKQQSGGKSGM